MIPVASFDRWYYAQGKKKVGPVSVAELRRLLAECALKPADMVLQEGMQKWRPLAEVAGSDPGTARTGSLWKLALGGSVGLGLLALLVWVWIASSLRPNGKGDAAQAEQVVETTAEPAVVQGTDKEANESPRKGNEDSPRKVDAFRPTEKEKSKTSAEPIADRVPRQPRRCRTPTGSLERIRSRCFLQR